MPPARLRLKVIKDAAVDHGDGVEPGSAQLRVLDMAMLPFTIYLRIQLPEPSVAPQPIFLHLLGRPGAPGRPNPLFLTVRLPEPPAGDAPLSARRILLLLTGDEIPDGRYRLALVRDRQHIAFADLAKRPDQVRVSTRSVAPPPMPISPILISGTHKSGTTWLEKVIDAHPDFIVLHEANTFNVFDQGELRRMVAARQKHFRNRNYIRWLNPAFDVADFTRFLQISMARDLMLRLGRAWGSRYVADRTPGYSGLYAHLPRFWEELRIVHIVRHPLDVLVSRLFHEANLERSGPQNTETSRPVLQALNEKLDKGEPIIRGQFVSDHDVASDTLQNLLTDWRRDQDNYLAAVRASPDWLHLVKYEDFVDDFSSEAARMFSFIGTDPARTDVPLIQRRTSFEALSGGRSAGESDARSFYRKGVAGDWRNLFSERQAAALWDNVASTAGAFGYTLNQDAPVADPHR